MTIMNIQQQGTVYGELFRRLDEEGEVNIDANRLALC